MLGTFWNISLSLLGEHPLHSELNISHGCYDVNQTGISLLLLLHLVLRILYAPAASSLSVL